MKLEIGQTWKMRCGRTVEVLAFNATLGERYPFMVTGDKWVTRDGKYHKDNEDHIFDLVTLVDGLDVDAGDLAAETLMALGWVFDGTCWVQDRPLPYAKLADVLDRALLQASEGKGKERHATGDTPFEDQPMATINRQLGSIHGYIYQCHKKSLEALRLPAGRDVAELLGAINYLCGAVIALESWAAK